MRAVWMASGSLRLSFSLCDSIRASSSVIVALMEQGTRSSPAACPADDFVVSRLFLGGSRGQGCSDAVGANLGDVLVSEFDGEAVAHVEGADEEDAWGEVLDGPDVPWGGGARHGTSRGGGLASSMWLSPATRSGGDGRRGGGRGPWGGDVGAPQRESRGTYRRGPLQAATRGTLAFRGRGG